MKEHETSFTKLNMKEIKTKDNDNLWIISKKDIYLAHTTKSVPRVKRAYQGRSVVSEVSLYKE